MRGPCYARPCRDAKGFVLADRLPPHRFRAGPSRYDGAVNPPTDRIEASEPGAWHVWAGPILVAAAFVALAVWSWQKWPDVLVDFGRELYVPWQLASGKRLYLDIAYFNGPLSPWRCILSTLATVNMIVLLSF